MSRVGRIRREAERLTSQIRQVEATHAKQVCDFGDWLWQVNPTWSWHWPHLAYLRTQLDRVTTGEIDRLAIFMPPRHGKSEQSSVRYPVWRLEQNPATRVVLGAYNQTFADKLSRKARKIARTRFAISRERNSAAQWETEAGGGFRACGVGSPPTGEGADLLIIDDPIKRREEADSEAYREKVWEWYSEDLFSRLEPGAAIILILTRWHEDDLAGRILAGDDADTWTVVRLPALAEDDDPLGRQPGEPLCPDRYGRDYLARIERTMGWAFQPLYQQRAIAREGGLFKRHYFDHVVDALPVGCQLVRYWDTAGTKGAGCFTAGVLMAKDQQGYYYVAHVEREQLEPVSRERLIKATAESDKTTHGRLETWLEEQGGSSGKEVAQDTIRNLAGFSVYSERATGDKEVRAQPFAAQCGAGNVRLVRGLWNKAYIDELCSFPRGTYKDQVDASSGAFSKLAVPVPEYTVREIITTPQRKSPLQESDMTNKFPTLIRHFPQLGAFQIKVAVGGETIFGPEFKSQSEAAFGAITLLRMLGEKVPELGEGELRIDDDKKQVVEKRVKEFAEKRGLKSKQAQPAPAAQQPATIPPDDQITREKKYRHPAGK